MYVKFGENASSLQAIV